jgi:hypothetical protein
MAEAKKVMSFPSTFLVCPNWITADEKGGEGKKILYY